MNREILFRGKRLDNGEWVEGASIITFSDDGIMTVYMPKLAEKCIATHDDETDNIIGFENCIFYKVDPDTVCQYTGMENKNGTKFFDGDIVKSKDKFREHIGVISYANARFVVDWMIHKHISGNGTSFRTDDLCTSDEVIGNIFDNTELLGVIE
jgi:uncharacterized phage protein (TIGR01671 family)